MFRISESDSLQPHLSLNMEPTKGRLTKRLLFVVISAAFGTWFALGYSFTMTNTPQNAIVQWIRSVKCSRQQGNNNDTTSSTDIDYNSTDLWCREIAPEEEKMMLDENTELNVIWGINGCVLAGGAFLSGWLSNMLVAKFGNKNTLLWTNICGLAASILGGMSVIINSYEALIASRFLFGVQGGFAVAVLPMYIAEISPPHLRGALGTIPGATMVVGSLCSILLGLPQTLGTRDLWPWIFWLRLVPVVLLFLTFPFCPESPRYLMIVRRSKVEARNALVWLRGTEDVSDELKAMQIEEESQTSQKTVSVFGLFADPFLRKLTMIIIVMLLANQTSCVAGIALYSTAIFESAGLSGDLALLGTLGIFVLQIVAVLLTMVLMDRAGRKVLLLVGCFGSVGCLVALVTFMALVKQGMCAECQYGTVGAVLAFMFLFNIGPSFVPWVLVSEMYDQSSRGAAMMLASGVCNGTGILVAFAFPLMQAVMQEYSFVPFAVSMLACTIYLAVKLIETKGKEFAVIQSELREKLL